MTYTSNTECYRGGVVALVIALAMGIGGPAAAAQFNKITPTKEDQTITLDGRSLTLEQVVDVARHGAKIKMAPEALQRAADSYGLMLQAQAENVPVYRFNRGAGEQREIVTLTGDPMSEEAQKVIQSRFECRGGGPRGLEPDIMEEETLRAMLVVNANIATYEAASPGFIQGLVDMLNNGISPATPARGGRGESDFVPAVETMVGCGHAYYKGKRMPADEALRLAGVKKAKLGGNDDALNTTSALTAGMIALYAYDTHQYMQWTDLAWAMVLNGMNSSLTPMSMPVRTTRPYPWSNYMSARVLDMLRGSYLFDHDPDRIIQDPESMRAYPWRSGTAWEAWASLRDYSLIQLNSTDHNPTARAGVSPEDSWELSTPHFMHYYIKGGKYSNGKDGYIFSNSNWHPWPPIYKVEAFSWASATLSTIHVQAVNRFSNPFFTVVTVGEILDPEGERSFWGIRGGRATHWLWAEIKSLAMPLAPDAISSGEGVADISSVPLLKLDRARKALHASYELMAGSVLRAALWMDVRKKQDPSREFGNAPTAAWKALRKIVPLEGEPAKPPTVSNTTATAEFMKANPVSTFYTGGPEMPSPGTIPIARTTSAQ